MRPRGHRMQRLSPVRVLAVLLLFAVSPACRVSDLAFRQDNRLEIVAPEDRSTTSYPVTVRWVMHDRTDVDSFVVVVDGSPQPPGAGLDDFFKRDSSCRGASMRLCLQPDRLAERGLYQTKRTQITFPILPSVPGVAKSEENRHEVTIGLLDASGRRINESSWTVSFIAAGAGGSPVP